MPFQNKNERSVGANVLFYFLSTKFFLRFFPKCFPIKKNCIYGEYVIPLCYPN
jgi:hypothetical protein